MIFGIKKDELINLGAEFTSKEINQQPKLWRETYEIVKTNKEKIKEFLSENLDKETRVILTGAGTSDYVGQTIYLYLAKKLKVRVEAIPTTDLVSNPAEFIEEDTKTI